MGPPSCRGYDLHSTNYVRMLIRENILLATVRFIRTFELTICFHVSYETRNLIVGAFCFSNIAIRPSISAQMTGNRLESSADLCCLILNDNIQIAILPRGTLSLNI